MARVKPVRFSNNVIHLLHRASQFADYQLEAAAAETGLTARQLVVLDTISRLDQPSQSDICVETGVDRSTLADMVRRLCARRLVLRRRSRIDGRAYILRLTDEGQRCLDVLAARAGLAEFQVMSLLPESQRHSFIEQLQLIAAEPLASPSRKH